MNFQGADTKLLAKATSEHAAFSFHRLYHKYPRTCYFQHYDKIIASLREEIEERDQELERLRLENSSLIQAEADSSLQLEKYEKMMISEINDECKKTADLLGVQPRRAQAVT